MTQWQSLLKKQAAEWGIGLSDEQLEQFLRYAALLGEWNEKINLTAITQPEEVAVKHFLDSLSPLRFAGIPPKSSLIDVGTGAGFPGIPLLIVRPDIRLTLLDSLNKRLLFLQDVLEELKLKAITVHARAEEVGRDPQFREKYDFSISRAVAPLNILCEYCLPFIKPEGRFISMKGPQAKEEIEQSLSAFTALSGKLEKTEPFSLPDGSGRTIIIIKKAGYTKKIYPRHGSKIAKKPL